MSRITLLLDPEAQQRPLPEALRNLSSQRDPANLADPVGQSWNANSGCPPSPELRAAMLRRNLRHSSLALAVVVPPSCQDGTFWA
jgi:hypothetical protein